MKIKLVSVLKATNKKDFICWLKYHSSLLFDEIIIIDNDSPSWVEEECKLIDNVTYISYPGKMTCPLQSEIFVQIGLKQTEETWVTFIDDDEFLWFADEFENLPRNWLESMISKFPKCEQFSLWWKYLCTNKPTYSRSENFIEAFRYSSFKIKTDKNNQRLNVKSFIKFYPGVKIERINPHMMHPYSIDAGYDFLIDQGSDYKDLSKHNAFCYHFYYLTEVEFKAKWASKQQINIRTDSMFLQKYDNIDFNNSYYEKDDNLYKRYKNTPDLLVSLTTWPKRINESIITIDRLLKQKTDCNYKIFLVLSKEEFNENDNRLNYFYYLSKTTDKLEIFWINENIKSYKKLLPIYQKFGNKFPILVCDDDILYPEDWLDKLWQEYRKDKTCVYANYGDTFCGIKNGILQLKNEINGNFSPIRNSKSFINKPAGSSGVLYPSNIFNDIRFYDYELIKKISPTDDDTWFWIWTILGEHKVMYVEPGWNMNDYIHYIQWSGQAIDVALSGINKSDIMEDIYLKVLLEFPKLKEILCIKN